MSLPPVALVIGAGDATGGAVARRFARGGYTVCATRRTMDKLQPLIDSITAEGGIAHGFASDARKEEEVVALVERIESTIGAIEVLVFNIGANAPSSILDHVAHLIVDAAIDTAFIRDNFPERYALRDRDGIVDPEHIAKTYWMLHRQPRDAWTHELDLRPWIEKF